MPPGLHPALLERLQRLAAGPRRLLGVVGPPGAGKSTLAALMAAALGERAQVVPMDGFHLAQTELERLGRAPRKGAPDTFDAAGYAALLRRLRQQGAGKTGGGTSNEIANETGSGIASGIANETNSEIASETVYAPDFRREIEEPVAGAIPVFAQTPLVISEGNYLLLQSGGWAPVQRLFDDIWYLHVEPRLRLSRLTERHMRFGRSREQAEAWIAGNDELNARVIEASAHRAHRQVRWNESTGLFETLT